MKFDMSAIWKDNSDCCILEVYLEYPEKLHNLHNDYLLAPKTIETIESMLSNYCEKTASKDNISVGGVKKLISKLCNKNRYLLHYWNMQLYVQLGMKLTKLCWYLSICSGSNHTLILILKEQGKLWKLFQSKNLKKTSSSWWITVSVVKQCKPNK